jgi:hypothetical protein
MEPAKRTSLEAVGHVWFRQREAPLLLVYLGSDNYIPNTQPPTEDIFEIDSFILHLLTPQNSHFWYQY